ncbi:phosphoribosyltransferase [Leisingera aquaemixtae]|uniref:Phosphoribosyltransferase n=1 Tax=Leisingera aquaemixtae TaxID=1396826 RepID=A0A0P1H7R8_9RHOB|nr:phosphoribosyltransferase [Leisingera aquaemixtae]UWQ25421.1 phosphoribosyltransferase [Leisingera aquaemixtae]UWQ42053.1 phosphoribosyltransferase [Leisingera aquaemixtae]UWQ46340.1 phosphoribosyltransferase [Leisingera aquaemixtae]CUH98860.1 Putative phosphoribosyl transferasec/MT0597 [Leisingera aquaemixtae]
MFEDRITAGLQLAERLAELEMQDPVVLALPRGGVPVALPIAQKLNAPLDLILIRKIGMPANPELAAGALAEGSKPIFNDALLQAMGMKPEDFASQVAEARKENAARRASYLQGRDPVDLEGRTVIVVDDGIATGATFMAAHFWLKERKPAEVILAVPVAPPEAVDELRPLVDTVVCLLSPREFWAVGAHYRDFAQTSDDEVTAALAAAPQAGAGKDKTWH